MAPEETAGPRYRGFGMSRCAYKWGLKQTPQGALMLVQVWGHAAASLLTEEEDSPQRRMAQYFNNVQRVEVGHKQVRLSVS